MVSAEVAALTGRVLKIMLLSKLKLATAVLVLISLVVTGVSLTRLSARCRADEQAEPHGRNQDEADETFDRADALLAR